MAIALIASAFSSRGKKEKWWASVNSATNVLGPSASAPTSANRGIGRMLLFKCLETMSAKHVFFAYFLWTDEDAARLYSLAGFERRREFAVMRKLLNS